MLVVMLSACAVLGGCLEFEQTVELQADGSGTQQIRMVVRNATLDELERAAPAARLGERGDPKAIFDEQRVAQELATAGLELKAHKVTKSPDRKTVELTASFASVAVLQKSPLAGSAAEWQLAAGPRPGTARLTLFPQGQKAWQEARDRANAMQTEDDPLVAEFFRKRKAQLAGLDVVMRFRLPGDVLVWTANMEKTGDREVTARITAAQLETPQDLVRRLAPRFEVIFDASGCSLLR